jgi:enterochelin esterase-like enzyme
MVGRGKVVIETVRFQALSDNPLGDPADRSIPIYLPPGYETDVARRYPVIYWLHGFSGTALAEAVGTPWAPALPELMDAVIHEGAPVAMVVMADGFTKYGCGQFINSSATGRYEDAIIELVAFIDRRFRTMPASAHRGLDGKSSGGYAALVLGMRNPDIFGAVASHSGDLYFEACYRTGFWEAANTVQRYGGLESFLATFLTLPKKPPDMVRAMATMVAMAMAYSPNPDSPAGFDLPVNVETGELNKAVWRRWLTWDPVVIADAHADALRAMRLVYFECGSRDQFFSHFGARLLHQRLERLGVAHEYQEFDDDHSGVNYRYPESLRRLCFALGSGVAHPDRR